MDIKVKEDGKLMFIIINSHTSVLKPTMLRAMLASGTSSMRNEHRATQHQPIPNVFLGHF